MAIDRALAERATMDGCSVLRLYRWQANSVSLGANEAATRTWDRERLERLKVPVVRRPTGGRGVWHDRTDLTYSATAPLAKFGDLHTAYRQIHEQLARALGRLGIAAELAPRSSRPTLAPGACFELSVGGEVLVDGRKTIGSAQALIRTALLQHGVIARAGRGPALARFRLGSSDTNPDIPAGGLPPPDLLAQAITATWSDEGATIAPAGVVEWAVQESASYLAHFQDPIWTWRR